ncbi:MAG: PQQ-binding-like beta-propeller repeat protein [Candidatus Bathyarchaeota archaeon]|nr:PQQ-binding-like beta-propeller repeat protein [Candidatus Bathyarchaeota archaeon]
MKKFSNKRAIATVIATILIVTISVQIIQFPATNAHSPAWEIPSFAFVVAQPTLVGAGQQVSVFMWVDAPMPSSAEGNDYRRHDYVLTITKPDGTTEVTEWPVVVDTTGVQSYFFTPTQVGNYTLLFQYKGQKFTWNATAVSSWTNDYFKPANDTTTITVQEDPVTAPILGFPLPTEYWTRPIEGQNTDWWKISSNWLNPPFIRIGDSGTQGATSTCDTQGGYGRYQPDGTLPNSPHIMWTRPIQDGGVVGGGSYDVLGKTYYMGGSYNVRFTEAVVMNGRLSYLEPWGNSGSGGDYICVDLRTGEEIWRVNYTTIASVGKPVAGYLYSYDMMNQHGVPPNGYLFTLNFARAYDPATGRVMGLNITNVPSSLAAAAGSQGEVLRYIYNSAGKWLGQWNSSKVFTVENTGTIDAGTAARYDWNVTIPSLSSGTWTVNRHLVPGQLLLLTQGSMGGPRDPQAGMNVTAISIKEGSQGQILWNKFYKAAPDNATRKIMAIDGDAGVFTMQDKENLRLTGYSLTDGSMIWDVQPEDAKWDTMRSTTIAAYGNLYVSGFDGIMHCYDIKTGDLIWTYGNGGPGNTTYSGLETAWGVYPIFADVVADGKIILGTTEHSPDSPFYKDAQYRCINATTGEEIWTMMGWGTGMYVGQSDLVADGFFVYLNCYDSQIYCVGKGPSQMTVDAPKASIEFGRSLVISGTVTDIAAGTKQNEQAARFPNGVPAVSDESMGEWMEYVYMQKPRPANTTGVPVTLSVVDDNGNYREIGVTTTDSNGAYSYQWTPDIEGKFVVYASFAGSESYWPSQAETAFAVDPAPATPTPSPIPVATASETYLLPGIAGIIVTIIVVGAILALLVTRKKP